MVVQLIDEVAIMAYFETLVGLVPGLAHVVNIDAAADPKQAVGEYITNTRLSGMVLFVSIHEGVTDLNEAKAGYEFSVMLNVLKQVSDIKIATMLQMRKDTRECLLKVIGKLVDAQDETREAGGEVLWELKRADERVLPTHEMANAKTYGHNTAIEFYVDMNGVFYY